jgi:hypothetical protein
MFAPEVEAELCESNWSRSDLENLLPGPVDGYYLHRAPSNSETVFLKLSRLSSPRLEVRRGAASF